VLDTSHQTLISLQEETDMLNLYIELENLRLNNSIAYSMQIQPGINMPETMVPPLLLQPCIENAIWHGLMYKNENRRLSFTIKKENDLLCFSLEDNGIGRQKATEIKSSRSTTHQSKGISLVEERLLLAGKQMNAASSINIIDLVDEDGNAAGTKIIVCLPYIKNNYNGRNT
jgi:sensor histidine kinase YesM